MKCGLTNIACWFVPLGNHTTGCDCGGFISDLFIGLASEALAMLLWKVAIPLWSALIPWIISFILSDRFLYALTILQSIVSPWPSGIISECKMVADGGFSE